MGAESVVEKEFISRLPPWLLPFKLNLQGNTGWPDRMILFIHPFIAFIEFKAPGRPLVGDRNQPERILELQRRGYPVLITDSADEALAFMETVALSTSGRSLNDLSGMRGASVAARLGEDILRLRGHQNPTGQEADSFSSGGGSPSGDVQRLASTDAGLGGVQRSKGDRPPWEE